MMCCYIYTAGEDEVRLTASKKEQQLLVELLQLQRICYARAEQISQLWNENELVQDKCKQLQTDCNYLVYNQFRVLILYLAYVNLVGPR